MLVKDYHNFVLKIQLILLGSSNSNFGEYSQDFLCFLKIVFGRENNELDPYQVNMNHYLYP